jgi:hypothetical protein
VLWDSLTDLPPCILPILSLQVVGSLSRKCQGLLLGQVVWVARLVRALQGEGVAWAEATDRALAELKERRLSRAVTAVLKVEPPVTWEDVGGLRYSDLSRTQSLEVRMS